ncbi:MAG: hypothetical protein RL518_1302 [Pseudomonadota bacterium]|jgi:hypothetical protein
MIVAHTANLLSNWQDPNVSLFCGGRVVFLAKNYSPTPQEPLKSGLWLSTFYNGGI